MSDPVAEHRRLNTTCGWSSREIGWDRQEKQLRNTVPCRALAAGSGLFFGQKEASGDRRDPVAEQRRLQTTCGWSSRQIAWDLQEKQARNMGGDLGMAMGQWEAQLFRHENGVQTIDEENLKDYIPELKSRGDLSRSLDGLLRSGDVVQLRWAGGHPQMALAALPASVGPCGDFALPCRATAAPYDNEGASTLRTAIRVYRNDFRIPSNVPLMSEECVHLVTLQSTGGLFLSSELRSFSSFAPLSERQEVRWARDASAGVLWKVRPLDPSSSHYLHSNQTVTLNHVSTNQDLTLESRHRIKVVFIIPTKTNLKQEDIIEDRHGSDQDDTTHFSGLFVPIKPIENLQRVSH